MNTEKKSSIYTSFLKIFAEDEESGFGWNLFLLPTEISNFDWCSLDLQSRIPNPWRRNLSVYVWFGM
jgi:hypothetical protein